MVITSIIFNIHVDLKSISSLLPKQYNKLIAKKQCWLSYFMMVCFYTLFQCNFFRYYTIHDSTIHNMRFFYDTIQFTSLTIITITTLFIHRKKVYFCNLRKMRCIIICDDLLTILYTNAF